MELPYVREPELAFSVAQMSTAVVLSALVAYRPLSSVLGSRFWLLGTWIAALAAPLVTWAQSTDSFRVLFFVRTPLLIGMSSLLFVVAAFLQPRRAARGLAVLGALLVHGIGLYVIDSDNERAVLQMIFGAIVYAFAREPSQTASYRSLNPARRFEVAIFVVGMIAATFVAVYVLDRFIASGDEWGYQYQADLFAHGRLYGTVPACPSVHETYWVYYWKGRAFCQYTPSWPLVLAPFQRLGLYWLASPVVFASGLVAVSRLARRAAGEHSGDPKHLAEAQVAGIAAPLVMCASGAVLLNAGSIFSHVFVCSLFAWAAEALFTITSPGLSSRKELAWAFALGTLAALLVGARPGDGAALLPGIAFYAVYALRRGNLRGRAVASALAGFLLIGGIILVILRVQLGEWFRTGYSLTPIFRPWGTIAFSWPEPDEWKYGIPLATGAYCFWPCALAVAAVGVVTSFGRARPVVLVLCAGWLLEYMLYSAVSGGRHTDWGYGPRYVLPTVIPMAVFTGVELAPLFVRLERLSSATILPVAAVVLAIVTGTGVVGNLLYPMAMEEIRLNGAPYRTIRAANLKHAVVIFPPGGVAQDPADLTQNLPTNPNPDVIYLIERSNREMMCARSLYPDRIWYRATGFDEVTLWPLD